MQLSACFDETMNKMYLRWASTMKAFQESSGGTNYVNPTFVKYWDKAALPLVWSRNISIPPCYLVACLEKNR